LHNPTFIAGQFKVDGNVSNVKEFGNGNINDTYIVTLNTQSRFVLQRINVHVFKQPHLIMQNLRTFTEHVHRRVQAEGHQWETPRVISTNDGTDFFTDTEGGFWRTISFIENSQSFDTIVDLDHAREVGHAVGKFQYLISDLPITALADTLEGFHITPQYLQKYYRVLAHNETHGSPEINYCKKFIENRKGIVDVLEGANLQPRPIHGDPKVNNVLIHKQSGKAISIVDLDTVKPGLVHYDIGDCLRSGGNPLGEDAENWEAVQFNLEIGSAILEGYFTQAQAFLNEVDYFHIYNSIRLLAFETGIRFFTDHLAGDVYYKVKYPGHNLHRALVQFKLTESIEAYEADIRQFSKKTVVKSIR